MGGLDDAVVAVFTKLFRSQLKIRGRATALARILTSQHTIELRWVAPDRICPHPQLPWVRAARAGRGFDPQSRRAAEVRSDQAAQSRRAGRRAELGVQHRQSASWHHRPVRLRDQHIVPGHAGLGFRQERGRAVRNTAARNEHTARRPNPSDGAASEKYTPVFDNDLKALESLDMIRRLQSHRVLHLSQGDDGLHAQSPRRRARQRRVVRGPGGDAVHAGPSCSRAPATRSRS